MSGERANLLVSPAELATEVLRIEGDRYRHLFRARRLALGDALRLVDGEGRARRGVVTAVDRHAAEVAMGEALAAGDPARAVVLWVAPPKPERAAWLVEKASELGVRAVRFVTSERAVRAPSSRDLERLRRVAAAALGQCGGSRLPEIDGPYTLDDELTGRLAASPTVFLDPASGVPLDALAPTVDAVLIGPEGGFSPRERTRLEAAGVAGARLGERVLRVETAALCAAALLLFTAPAPR